MKNPTSPSNEEVEAKPFITDKSGWRVDLSLTIERMVFRHLLSHPLPPKASQPKMKQK